MCRVSVLSVSGVVSGVGCRVSRVGDAGQRGAICIHIHVIHVKQYAERGGEKRNKTLFQDEGILGFHR